MRKNILEFLLAGKYQWAGWANLIAAHYPAIAAPVAAAVITSM
jgi:hypothetical protein